MMQHSSRIARKGLSDGLDLGVEKCLAKHPSHERRSDLICTMVGPNQKHERAPKEQIAQSVCDCEVLLRVRGRGELLSMNLLTFEHQGQGAASTRALESDPTPLSRCPVHGRPTRCVSRP